MDEQLAQALAQLRDIHEPAAPPFWPIPLGWWLLAICVVVAFSSLIWWLRARRIADRPYRVIRETAAQLQQLRFENQVTEHAYVAAINRLYKHLLVDVEAIPGAIRADGVRWLIMLATRFGNDSFVSGPGKMLGTIRYTPVSFFDDQLVGLVEKTLCVVRLETRKVLTA